MNKRTKIGGLFSGAERREQHGAFRRPLAELDGVIDWEFFREEIELACGYSQIGRRPHDPVLMFKIIVLQRYYDLSEEQTEFQILDRLSFQQFLGLEGGGKVPDKNAIWDFKERLGAAGARGLFERFNDYLSAVGLRAKGGKIVDASFVDVPRQHNTREENKEIKSGSEPEGWSEKKRAHKDTDARWTKKGGERHYGYKNHAKVARVTKLIDEFETSDAALHDSQAFDELMDEDADSDVWADSAYQSKQSGEMLKKKKIRNHIHERAYRNRPLSDRQKARNTTKSRVRARVEHVFGFQSMMGADRLRTIGLRRAQRGVGIANLVYNLFRFKQLNYVMI